MSAVCAHCGAICVPDVLVAGYAVTPKNEKICYSCAYKAQIQDLKDRSKPFTAYISCDGKRISTWKGSTLMTITRSRPCRLTRRSFTHDSRTFMSIHAVDVHGAHWYGRGSAGIVITLRPCKSC